MEKLVKHASVAKREKRKASRAPRAFRSLSKNSITDYNESDNIKLCLILRFKIQDYVGEVDFPENLKLYWHGKASADSMHLAQRHLQEIARLARFDQKNLTKHVKHLNKVTNRLGFLIDSTCVEFTGLTKKQVRECASNKSLDFEFIEITC